MKFRQILMLITFTGITYSFHNNFNHRSSSTKNLHSTTEFMRTLHSQLNMNNQNSDSSSLSTSNFDSSSNSLSKKIFCNVELNGQSVEAVGFDMDFTLAQYNNEFDLLAFNGAKEKLHTNLGYPKEVLDFMYTPESFRRGLIIDKAEGNILKIDRHKYHRKVYHGSQELDKETRKNSKYSRHVYSYTESEYVVIDTLFLLVDAVLFASLVDFKDKHPETLKNKSYDQLYKDVRQSVDLCHRDGVIKDSVMKDPKKFIIHDPDVVPMLKRYRQEGKKLFLLTNSMFEYTNAVMTYLVHGEGNLSPEVESWNSLFDVVIVGASKPAFLADDYLTLFRIESDGYLRNVEDKSVLFNVFGPGVGGRKIFQGGHWQDLQRLLGVSSGDKILYVGDHMYSDILKSKRKLGWRTCLIIPELDNELNIGLANLDLAKTIFRRRQLQYDLDEYMDVLRQKQRLGVDVTIQLQEAYEKSVELKEDLRRLSNEYNAKFNPMWGPLFKAGFQDSRFAKQVSDYACLYTSKASNLGSADPNKMFRATHSLMPHDQMAVDIEEFH